MPDIFSSEKRSEIMRRIKNRNSKAELMVFSYLRKNKIYFQKHYSRASGTPDIAVPRKKIAVFIDGEFWHGKDLQKLEARRGSADDYWVRKIKKNVERDRCSENDLIKNGWLVLRVWDSELLRKKTSKATLENIANFLKSR